MIVIYIVPRLNPVLTFLQRPFLNYYAPTFILYELSSPFLNIHWFLDKLNMTGGRTQWYNGIALLSTFFACRLVWGTWQSVIVYGDMWNALQHTWNASSAPLSEPVSVNAAVFYPARDGSMCINENCARANAEITRFKDFTAAGVPTWLVVTYVGSNLILNLLNIIWFSKMVETVRKRFRQPDEDVKGDVAHDAVLEAVAKLEKEETAVLRGDLSSLQGQVASGVDSGVADDLRKRRAELVAKVPLPGA
jgi:hypothetical protein